MIDLSWSPSEVQRVSREREVKAAFCDAGSKFQKVSAEPRKDRRT